MVTAIASFLDARSQGGAWIVRMEDVDETRVEPGAAETILHQLLVHGLCSDEEVVYQTHRKSLYQAALDRLSRYTYPCACTRREAADCRCRLGLPKGTMARSIRVQGDGEIDDFILRRADGLFAYQLAVVVDDFDQRITQVVRGEDLADSTPRQQYLQRLLGYPSPAYFHVPVATAPDGRKLSKQNQAPAVPLDRPADTIRDALRFLHQSAVTLEEAVRVWDRSRIRPPSQF